MSSGIRIVEVRVRNFKCLRQVDVELDQTTFIIGENNCGKSSFLEALSMAIGVNRRPFSPDDIFVNNGESKPPRDRAVVIDLLVRPVDDKGVIASTFPTGSFWLELWGNAIAQDDDENDFLAMRTEARWNKLKGEYVTERKFLSYWPPNGDDWNKAKLNETSGGVSVSKIEPIGLYLLDAKRDLDDEIKSRGSFWSKLVSDPGLDEAKIQSLEEQLNALNNDIIENSEVLNHVQTHLAEIHHATRSDLGSVTITPVARHLRDISKGMNVNFATKGAPAFPVGRHGMGTRSIAAILTFRAYSSWRQKSESTSSVHPMFGLEEPETHLHPQAQRALFRLLEKIDGQQIISSHSPFFSAEASIFNFRHFYKAGPDTKVRRIRESDFSKDEIRKVHRKVIETRGEMLYAHAIVFFEGDTEGLALPTFAAKFWGVEPSALGITFVEIGGRHYKDFIRTAEGFGIPWYIFSDGEANVVADVKSALMATTGSETSARTFFLPTDLNYETYICCDQYKSAIVEAIVGEIPEAGRAAARASWAAKSLNDCARYLSANKTALSRTIAEHIVSLPDKTIQIPGKIKELFEKMSEDLSLKTGTN